MITLGVLLGVLLIVFYGLAIFCSIREKRKRPKTDTDKSKDVPKLKYTDVALTNVKQSARFSSCIIAVLMIIVTALALMTEWLLVKPIHNEMVRKFEERDQLFFERNSICGIIDLSDFNMLTFPVACLITLIFILRSKRSSFMRPKLKGYIGPVIPIDFFLHIKRKFAAVVFAIMSNELLDIINQAVNGNTSKGEGCFFSVLRSSSSI